MQTGRATESSMASHLQKPICIFPLSSLLAFPQASCRLRANRRATYATSTDAQTPTRESPKVSRLETSSERSLRTPPIPRPYSPFHTVRCFVAICACLPGGLPQRYTSFERSHDIFVCRTSRLLFLCVVVTNCPALQLCISSSLHVGRVVCGKSVPCLVTLSLLSAIVERVKDVCSPSGAGMR